MRGHRHEVLDSIPELKHHRYPNGNHIYYLDRETMGSHYIWEFRDGLIAMKKNGDVCLGKFVEGYDLSEVSIIKLVKLLDRKK
jgi:hypothetical protein